VKIDVITIFPEYFGPLRMSLLGKAAERGILQLAVHDLRAWAHDVHRTVDDSPFGGGPGMVMTPGPWGEALDAVLGGTAADAADWDLASDGIRAGGGGVDTSADEGVTADTASGGGPRHGAGGSPDSGPAVDQARPRLVVPTPAGGLFGQHLAALYARCPHLVFACGRYEGIDARVAQAARDSGAWDAVDEVSIGDYVLSGGEPAVVVMIDAIMRLLPGVLGNSASAADDSFGGGGGPMAGLLEGPVYTRPRQWRGRDVPPVLLSGDHGAIARWQRDEALRKTALTRPDLVAKLAHGGLDARDRAVLSEAGFPITGEDMAH
jgi:tRNA (guanine37-N1)-methyltransferase